MFDKIIYFANRFGVLTCNLVLSTIIVLISAAITILFTTLGGFNLYPAIFLAIITPTVLAPPTIYVFLRIVRKLDRAEKEVARARKRLIDAFQSLPLQINLYDEEDRLIMTNREQTGWYKGGFEYFVPGRTYRDITHDLAYSGEISHAVGREEEWIDERLENFNAAAGPMEIAHPDGRIVEAGYYKTSLGETVVIRRDITQRKTAEQDARRRHSQLIHVMRVSTMGEMATGLAHELNQPLTAIAGFLQGCINRLEAGEGASPRVMDALRKSTEQSLRAGEIIRRIRDFVSATDHEYELIDINNSILETVEMLSSDIRLANVDLSLDLANTLPRARADQIQIQQVVFNLTRNGLDAINEVQTGENKLHIATTVDEDDLLIRIEDSGNGVDPEIVQTLFDPFFTTKESGMGMGLAICRAIILDHGGELWLENTDYGAASCVRLPIADREF